MDLDRKNAIVGEPCNVDAHAKIPALFRTTLCPRLCVHMHCKHWLWWYSCCLISYQSIASITHHTHRVNFWGPPFLYPNFICVCVVSPWMDLMLWLVREERKLYSHNQCVQYMCTPSRGHNIIMKRARILARGLTLHDSPTMVISWSSFFLLLVDIWCENFLIKMFIIIPKELKIDMILGVD